MNKVTIIDNEYATLWYYPDLNIAHHKFHKFLCGDTFRDFLTNVANLFEEKRCRKYLSDDRGNPVLDLDDMKWSEANYTPRIQVAGLKYWALVMPEKIVGQITLKRVMEGVRQMGIEVETFSEPVEAFEWLESQ